MYTDHFQKTVSLRTVDMWTCGQATYVPTIGCSQIPPELLHTDLAKSHTSATSPQVVAHIRRLTFLTDSIASAYSASLMSLRQLREQAGLTQVRLGFLLDVSPFTIAKWERGVTEPTASRIRRLAWALRVEESEVLEAICGVKQTA